MVENANTWYRDVFSQELGTANDTMASTGAHFVTTGFSVADGFGIQSFLQRDERCGPVFTLTVSEGITTLKKNESARGREFHSGHTPKSPSPVKIVIGREDDKIVGAIKYIFEQSITSVT